MQNDRSLGVGFDHSSRLGEESVEAGRSLPVAEAAELLLFLCRGVPTWADIGDVDQTKASKSKGGNTSS